MESAESTCPRVLLKKGHDAAVRHGHPWVFSGAIAGVEGEPQTGAEVDVCGPGNRWFGRGLYCAGAALAVRIYSRTPGQRLDTAFFVSRIREAVRIRDDLFAGRDDTNAWRVVFSEADGLSGIVMDRYADALIVHVDSRALAPHLPALVEAAANHYGIRRVLVRADEGAKAREGLGPEDVETLSRGEGGVAEIRENGFRFQVDLGGGQKTGYYLDQRENRRRAAAYARGRRVLSGYCYTGAFEVHAAAAGARAIVGVDSSEPALALAREHHRLNGLAVPADYRKADVPTALRAFRDAGEKFDLVILDPPRFVATRAQTAKGLRAYKDINLLAMKLLTPGGILATFSCSGLVSPKDFTRMVGWASADAERTVRILEVLGQPPDHPILAVCPETQYLKGLICRVE